MSVDVPLPEPQYMERDAIGRAYQTLPQVLPPDPPSAEPATMPGMMYQIGIADDPALSFALSRRLAHSDWNFGAQLTLSGQSGNPNDSDKNRGGSPLGAVAPTPDAAQGSSDGQTAPMTRSQLRQAVARQPHPPETTQVPIPVHPPAETICRDRR